ncbi:ABC transporter permease [Treponema brennaborense]|nr:FtsX-like permease family protein [Treponema brennaborense]
MAWKNIFRYKRRTLVTASAIAFGVLFTVLFDALIFGISNESEINILEYETPGAKLLADGYFEEIKKLPMDYLIEENDSSKIISYLESKKLPYTKEIQTECEIYFNEDYFETSGSMAGIVSALDCEKAKDVFSLHESIESGTWLKKEADGSACTGAVVGSWMADDMKAQPGYFITVQCKGRGGFSQTIDVPIIGIIHCPNMAINSSYIFMDIDYIDEMLAMEKAVTAIDVGLGGGGLADRNFKRFSAEIKKTDLLHNGPELKSWRDIQADILSVDDMYSLYCNVIMAFMFIIAAVGISNTMLMSVMERRNEIAMLKAMGYSSFYVKRLFMWEGVSIGIVGCIIGCTVACLLNIPLSAKGIDFTSTLSTVSFGYRISGLIKSGWDIPGFIRVTLGALLVAGAAAFIPTNSILKKEVADIFRKN